MKTKIATTILSFVVAAFAFAQTARADDVADAQNTLARFEQTDPGIKRLVDTSAGYAIFPSIGKGAIGVGGAHGSGVLFEHGQPVGKAKMTQVTVGFQLGGQVYSEIIFFKDPDALNGFRSGNFALSAQASAVALSAGVSGNLDYRNGVAVITATKTGLMYEASVGGQKFSFSPYKSTAQKKTTKKHY